MLSILYPYFVFMAFLAVGGLNVMQAGASFTYRLPKISFGDQFNWSSPSGAILACNRDSRSSWANAIQACASEGERMHAETVDLPTVAKSVGVSGLETNRLN